MNLLCIYFRKYKVTRLKYFKELSKKAILYPYWDTV